MKNPVEFILRFMKTFITVFILCSIGLVSSATDKNKKVNPTVSPEEMKLYALIMEYRKANHLPLIPLSLCLTFVAQQHCIDLAVNKPDKGEGCNAHSWSRKGKWTPCCYTPDHKQASCMWIKPRELTNYEDNGFEIACGTWSIDFVMTADYALDSWKHSEHHNNVILNKDKWRDMKWNAIGIGVYNGYAAVWFGAATDKEGPPKNN